MKNLRSAVRQWIAATLREHTQLQPEQADALASKLEAELNELDIDVKLLIDDIANYPEKYGSQALQNALAFKDVIANDPDKYV